MIFYFFVGKINSEEREREREREKRKYVTECVFCVANQSISGLFFLFPKLPDAVVVVVDDDFFFVLLIILIN